jgi:Tfp pilus assembly protein PilV
MTMARMNSHSGFTLIEALIGALLLSLSLLGVVGMMVYFGTDTADKTLRDCLLDNATNGLTQLRANLTVSASRSITCGASSGTLTVSPNTFPATANTCSDVTATAAAGGKTLQMTTRICNFQ